MCLLNEVFIIAFVFFIKFLNAILNIIVRLKEELKSKKHQCSKGILETYMSDGNIRI